MNHSYFYRLEEPMIKNTQWGKRTAFTFVCQMVKWYTTVSEYIIIFVVFCYVR